MSELRGNISIDVAMKSVATGLGSSTWQGSINHTRPAVYGSGLGKVNQACIYQTTVGALVTNFNLMTLPALAAASDKAVQSDGDITLLNLLIIKNLSTTANITIAQAGVNGVVGIGGIIGPGGVLLLDYGSFAKILSETGCNIQMQATGAATPVQIYMAGS